MEETIQPRASLTPCQRIERSLITKYRKSIWNRFIGGIKDYQLIREGDRIAVCISGGKDSMLLAKCMQQLHRHSEIPFGLEFLVMDPGYRPENRQRILQNAEQMEIPIHIFETEIFDVVAGIPSSPCYLCARMRRGYLYSRARELGCNKIALGHHFDDVVETVLMSTLYGAEYRTMMPKLHSQNFPGMELIRPLYLVRERDIIAWKNYHNLTFLQCACRFTEAVGKGDQPGLSKRQEVKELIARLRRDNPQVDVNIFRSVHSVNLDTIIGWRSAQGGAHSFLEGYEEERQ